MRVGLLVILDNSEEMGKKTKIWVVGIQLRFRYGNGFQDC